MPDHVWMHTIMMTVYPDYVPNHLAINACSRGAVASATAEAAKPLVAFVQTAGRATVPSVASRVWCRLTKGRAFTLVAWAVAIATRKVTEARVILCQASFDRAGDTDGTATGWVRRRLRAGALLPDERCGFVGVDLEVVGVRELAAVLAGVRRADGVINVTPRAQDPSEIVQAIGRGLGSGPLAREPGAAPDIVALVGDVVWVAEKESGADLVRGSSTRA